jgi:hypothetical protein
MTYRRLVRVAVCAATLCGAIVGPVAGASASVASIKAAIVSYNSKIDVAEGHVLTAVGEYKESKDPKDPAGVEAAIGNSVAVIGSLKAKVAHQSAATRRAKRAKAKILAGLQAIIVGYKELSSAYVETTTSPEAAMTEATKAAILAKKGRKELGEGVKLLR